MYQNLEYKSTSMHFAIPIRALWQRFSVFLMVMLSIAIIIMSKLDSTITSTIQTKALDIIIPVATTIAKPVDAAISAYDSIVEVFYIREENATLRKENDWLRHHLLNHKEVQAENVNLRKILNVIADRDITYLTARIVGDTSGPYIRSVVTNAGNNNGVKKGQAVVNEDGLIGRVIEVGSNISRILLLTDLSSKIPVITSKSRLRAIAAGNNSDKLQLLYVPEKNTLEIGELVLTSGDGHLFPADLVVGKIHAIEDSHIVIAPTVSWNRLEYISIINMQDPIVVAND